MICADLLYSIDFKQEEGRGLVPSSLVVFDLRSLSARGRVIRPWSRIATHSRTGPSGRRRVDSFREANRVAQRRLWRTNEKDAHGQSTPRAYHIFQTVTASSSEGFAAFCGKSSN